jgi:predicted dehydrogenase
MEKKLNMKVLVIGLGSMGKRRVRNLIEISPDFLIYGYDVNPLRSTEASSEYNIRTTDNFDLLIKNIEFDFFIISTPPKSHMEYAYVALNRNIPAFIEASVLDKDKILSLALLASEKSVYIRPSNTLFYFPLFSELRNILLEGILGKAKFLEYHSGQSVYDWHPWEDVMDYYVSDPETSAARELVTFELTIFSQLFGDLMIIDAYVDRIGTGSLSDIIDIYNFKFKSEVIDLAIMTIQAFSSPRAIRSLFIQFELGQLFYNLEDNIIKIIYDNELRSEIIKLESSSAYSGYINPDLPYKLELEEFINGMIASESKSIDSFRNNLFMDYKIISLLEKIENLAKI